MPMFPSRRLRQPGHGGSNLGLVLESRPGLANFIPIMFDELDAYVLELNELLH